MLPGKSEQLYNFGFINGMYHCLWYQIVKAGIRGERNKVNVSGPDPVFG
jgi:hypothetical protein